jgi:8-hydroxy-5-deazaflavin:NADPH oxidoreductase
MKIAIIGTGNVGGALATKWADKGHEIYLGARDTNNFKGIELLKNQNTTVHSIIDAVKKTEVILISTPAPSTIEVVQSLGNTQGKVIIDAMNTVLGRGADGYLSTTSAILAHTDTKDVVKCFNTTGANNIKNPIYDNTAIDAFVCGDSKKGKEIASILAKDAGFGECYDVGGNDRFELMEQFAFFWINLAMFQKQGREIGFKLLKR